MRLHTLQVTAFGPFAGSVEVDFDQLSQAGLFLLSGATGAGKTSVLDAVCFALYGEVPGDRNTAKRLRSDQAAPDVAPCVELEASLGGRRFRLRRSPAWERPKRRGRGTTVQQASVVIRERVGLEWITRTTRLDEAGHLVTALLGMNLTQFCQVALLPQGRFQSFLRARSEERHQLLQQLFRTQRFADIESWLGEHRRTLRREAAAAEDRVTELTNRFSEASAAPVSSGTGAPTQRADELRTWVAVSLDKAAIHHDKALAAHDAASRSLTEAAALQVRTQALALLQQEHAAALAEARRLDRTRADHVNSRIRLDRASRAEQVAVLARLVEESGQRARSCATTAKRRHPGSQGDLDDVAVVLERTVVAHEAAVEEVTRLRALRPRDEELHRQRAAVEEWRREISVLDAFIASLLSDQAEGERDLVALDAALATAHRAQLRLVELRQRRDVLTGLIAAHRQHADLTAQAAAAGKEVLAQRALSLELKEEWLSIREARLSGMAAEIAGQLAVGSSCPVCGSAEHPSPARAAPNAPDASHEHAARAALTDAEAALHAFEDHHRHLLARLGVLAEQLVTGSLSGMTRERAAVDRQLTAADAHPVPEEIQRLLARTRTDLAQLVEQLASARSRRDSLAGRVAQLGPGLIELADEVAGALAAYPDVASVGEALALVEPRLADLSHALTAVRAWDTAEAAHRRDVEALDVAAAASGFVDGTDAVDAQLPSAEREALEDQVRDFEDRMQAAQAILDDPEHLAAVARSAADTVAAGQALEAARAELTQAEIALANAEAVRKRLESLATELLEALTAWCPLLEDLQLAARVAALADGTATDNVSRMRLSAYVLAYRLGQVVAAANERLVRMSDQRYSLEHSERRGAGERKGGLSLLVRDDWSGESRDPATLSGGETFVVSLALALGLADVIAHEIGGAELDTLFVDEGFGALDSETLDDVMDTLDSLREGGRVVGVVSHVTEMRHRIPTRLQVTKRRTGSTLALVHGP
jgi:DNA repair protein SbcC/Rad50